MMESSRWGGGRGGQSGAWPAPAGKGAVRKGFTWLEVSLEEGVGVARYKRVGEGAGRAFAGKDGEGRTAAWAEGRAPGSAWEHCPISEGRTLKLREVE